MVLHGPFAALYSVYIYELPSLARNPPESHSNSTKPTIPGCQSRVRIFSAQIKVIHTFASRSQSLNPRALGQTETPSSLTLEQVRVGPRVREKLIGIGLTTNLNTNASSL